MNIINKVSEFLDDHVRVVTKIGYVVTSIGVFSIARRSRLLTKFTNPADIPNNFVHRRVKLRGLVKNFSLDNTVHVDHIPAFKFPAWLRRKRDSGNFLCLSLAGTKLDETGCDILNNELKGKIIWFQLLNSTRPMPFNPPVILYIRKALILRNVNVYAVRMGYAVVDHLPECDHARTQKHLQKDIFKAQKYAAKKKLGAWKD